MVLLLLALAAAPGATPAPETPAPTAPATESPAAPDAPALPGVSAVMDKLDDLYRSGSSHGTLRMEVKTKHYERSMTLEEWSRGSEEALIVVREPAREAGTATLKTEEGLWNYAPRADRLVRIPSGLLSDSWMGSHFTNEDLVRETDFDEDYDTTLAWIEEDGERKLQATMIPEKDAPVIWTKIVYVLGAKDWLPERAEFHDGDEVVRTMSFSEVKALDGRRIPTRMEVAVADKPGEYTRMIYESMEFDGKVDRSLFTPRGLRRIARP